MITFDDIFETNQMITENKLEIGRASCRERV